MKGVEKTNGKTAARVNRLRCKGHPMERELSVIAWLQKVQKAGKAKSG
jgi:hypothetical protein